MFSRQPAVYDQPRKRDVVYSGERTKQEKEEFPSNFIKTSKYNIITFLPGALLLQFTRYANIYFLFTAIIQSISILSPLNPFSAIAPLVFVLGLSMLREGIEDVNRHRSDAEVNATECTILKDNQEIQTTWADIQVGDLLVVKENEAFPADLVVLGTFYETGVCFIETSSLDGEKNLKPKSAMSDTLPYFKLGQIKEEPLTLEAGKPNQALYEYEGSINFLNRRILLNQKQLLLRGAYLRNTKWIVGAAVYTGLDTKIMRNAEPARNKSSRIEQNMNQYILGILAVQLSLCAVMAVLSKIWLDRYMSRAWYLEYSSDASATTNSILIVFTYFLLFNTMIPISLIVSLEFVKLFQAYFIQKDSDLYVAERDRWAKVSSSSINEELGQVEYIFSDKTGTLTCNQMEFKYCIIGDVLYGDEPPVSEADPPTKSRFGSSPEQSSKHQHSVFHFKDQRLENILKNPNDPAFPLANEYFTLLSTAHECLVEKDEATGQLNYQGPSPDEITLVDAASRLGYQFLGASASTMDIRIVNQKIEKQVTLLRQFEFNSTRKRMSSILRIDGQLKLYIKGADSIIAARLKTQNGDIRAAQPYYSFIQDRLDDFARIGLRTLLMAMKDLSEVDYAEFESRFNSISDDLDRETEIDKLADELERDLFLIGATAVEDKLQKDVPETIADLLKANIKVWMLTGDKLETAENIARSCRLIQGDMTVLRLATKEDKEIDPRLEDNEQTFNMCVAEGRKKSYLVEGESLALILQDKERTDRFVNVTKDCDSVVCCRVTPKQKALVVRMIKNALGKITLAIGDGANDVNMIQEAHIGVGLYGNEGMRAVQASDFAFAEFQCLWRLLLVHGHWSYIRICEMIVYFFYKNMIFTIPQFYFAFFSGYSGQTVFDDWFITFYNLFFTALPLVARATLDQDVNYYSHLYDTNSQTVPVSRVVFSQMKQSYIKSKMPSIYYLGQKNELFTVYVFLYWAFQGLAHAIIIFGITYFSMGTSLINSDGSMTQHAQWSITMFTAIILTVDIKITIFTRYFTFINFIAVIPFSLLLYGAYLCFSEVFSGTLVERTAMHLFVCLQPYLTIIVCLGIIFIVDLTIIFVASEFNTTVIDALRLFTKYSWHEKPQLWKGVNGNGVPEVIGVKLYQDYEIQKRNLFRDDHQRSFLNNEEQIELINMDG